MNIDVKMTYLKYLLLAGAMCAFGSCQREDGPLDLPQGKPIEMSAKIENSNLSKADDDTSLDIFVDKDIVVWCNLTTTDDDTREEFGGFGTQVHADSDNYGKFTGWSYNPQRYWIRGNYQFASVAPATLFKTISWEWGSNQENKTADVPYGWLEDDTITLEFGEDGEDGYDLSANQDDIMAAFSNSIDNTDNGADEMTNGVGLNFTHQLSLISIQAAAAAGNSAENAEITITGIKIWGNHKNATKIVITPTSIETTFTGATDTTTVGTPFYYKADSIKLENSGYVSVLENDLIVFPEECGLNLEVTYTVNGLEKVYTKQGYLPVKWETGQKYTYQFTVSLNDIKFSTPTVEPWREAVDVTDEPIEM